MSASVLLMSPGPLGERLAGPEIRALEFARALAGSFAVTLSASGRERDGVVDGMRVIAADRRRLAAEARRHDAVLSSCLPPYLMALRRQGGPLAIADMYDPYENELATLQGRREREREARGRAAIEALHLRHADVVLCAGQRQRQALAEKARRLGVPGDRAADPVVLPFGIPVSPPISGRRPLRERFAQICEGDTVVLWWGTVWRWLDAESVIRTMALLGEMNRSDVKLVVTAGRPPDREAARAYDATEQARELAARLGVLDRTVLFLDEWIPYDQRFDYLREAQLGITLHRHEAEAQLAARARYMDYLAAGLPCVLGRGDEDAAEFEAAGFATLPASHAPEELARVLLRFADDPAALAAAAAAGSRLAAERSWGAVGERLRATVIAALEGRRDRAPEALAALGGAGAYYARRAVDRIAVGR